jgi:hypothetical protein
MLRGGLGQLSGEEILLMALKTGDTSRLATSQIRRPSDLYRENNGNSKFVDYRTASLLLLHWPYYSSQKESSASRGLAATSLRAQGNISRPTKVHPPSAVRLVDHLTIPGIALSVIDNVDLFARLFDRLRRYPFAAGDR